MRSEVVGGLLNHSQHKYQPECSSLCTGVIVVSHFGNTNVDGDTTQCTTIHGCQHDARHGTTISLDVDRLSETDAKHGRY